ncbi:hypothetical protein Q1695_010792 [Nippostrongylus brasiliensis]|nr:hypothetical protein Q1695_010792 [Nippostrongylus brasiliensis]
MICGRIGSYLECVWSNGTLLSLTVKNSEESAVRMLREAGCPIYPDHLRIIRSSYSASMFDAKYSMS